jgi:cell division protein FtsB
MVASKTNNLKEMARAAWVPALCVGVIGYFAYHAVVGPTGLFAWGGYKRERARLEQVAGALDMRRDTLAHRAKLLDPRAVDPDMADELVRKNLGVVRPDELVIPLR